MSRRYAVALHDEQTRQYPLDVSVQHRYLLVKCDAQNRSRCVAPDTGQLNERIVSIRDLAFIFFDDDFSGLVQVAGAGIISEPLSPASAGA